MFKTLAGVITMFHEVKVNTLEMNGNIVLRKETNYKKRTKWKFRTEKFNRVIKYREQRQKKKKKKRSLSNLQDNIKLFNTPFFGVPKGEEKD